MRGIITALLLGLAIGSAVYIYRTGLHHHIIDHPEPVSFSRLPVPLVIDRSAPLREAERRDREMITEGDRRIASADADYRRATLCLAAARTIADPARSIAQSARCIQ